MPYMGMHMRHVMNWWLNLSHALYGRAHETCDELMIESHAWCGHMSTCDCSCYCLPVNGTMQRRQDVSLLHHMFTYLLAFQLISSMYCIRLNASRSCWCISPSYSCTSDRSRTWFCETWVFVTRPLIIPFTLVKQSKFYKCTVFFHLVTVCVAKTEGSIS